MTSKIIFTIVKRKDIDLVRNNTGYNPMHSIPLKIWGLQTSGVFPKKSGVNNTMDYIRVSLTQGE